MTYKPENTYDAEHKIWSGPQSREFFAHDLSIGEIIFHEMRRHPQLIAQISVTENTVLSRKDLHLNSMRVASYMRSLKLKQTDVVGIIARNTTHLSAVAYGCFFNGIAFHSLNTAYEQSKIEQLFDITKPRLIFCDGDEYDKIKSATKKLNVKIITMRNHKSDSISIDKILATPVEADFQPFRLEHGNDQTLAILCSSGTTGTPKAVTISNSRKILNQNRHLTINDVQYSHSTLDWVTALVTVVTSGVYSTKRIVADTPFDPVSFLRSVKEHKITWVIQAPSHMALIANCPEFKLTNLDSIRCYLYGGGKCSVEVQHTIRSRLASDCLHNAYAFTEVGSVVSMNFNFDEKPNAAGRLAEDCQLKVLDEHGVALGPNEVGELCVRNGQYWAGYYDNPEETKKIRDSSGWFHSGDLGYMDDDGFLYIVGRKKEMLKCQNMMYYPSEIEDVISKMPGVAEVCVFGIWNQINGDEPAAAVVRKSGAQINAEDVVDYVKQHSSASYKHLHAGALIVDDLKRYPNGKTNRQATKAYFLEVNGIK